MLVGAGVTGKPELTGSGSGVTVAVAGFGAASVLATGCGPTVVRGSGAGARAGPVLRGDGAVVTGALGVAVGVATGTGTGVGPGVGRGEARMIGASLSTGPCARGSLVGRLPGIRKSGTDWAGAAAGASKSPSAAARIAAFTLPLKSCIDCSIFLRPAR